MEWIKGLFKRGSTSRESGLNKELTNVHIETELAQVQELNKTGVIMIPVWQTCNDSLVCDICKSFHDKRADIYEVGKRPKWIYKKTGKEYGPPLCHEGCRCWLNFEFE